MTSVFNREDLTLGGAFQADRATLTITQAGAQGLLVQRMSLTYAQAVSKLYDITSRAVYYVAGRTQGQAGLDRVIGPVATIKGFYTCFGDVCRAKKNTLSLDLKSSACANAAGAAATTGLTGQELTNGCTTASTTTTTQINYVLQFCVVTQIGIGLQAQDMVISENLAMMFSSLKIGPDACACERRYGGHRHQGRDADADG